jgi:short-subunit dehydrogenase
MNKLIVVTGGTKGIGRAIVKTFAQMNFDIVTCSRNESELAQLKSEIEAEHAGSNVFYKRADLSNRNEVDVFVNYINGLERPVEILINNTGVFIPGSVHDEPEGNIELMINTNLYSAYYLTRGLVGGMIKRKSGHIFNICSTASIMPYINGGSYCISKYALYGMTKVLREEMKEYNIRVTAILPGATRTASWDGVELPPERFIKARDVAEAVRSAWSMSGNSVVEDILIRPQLGDI